ncbi:MAG: hypothetical protein CMM50_13035 [Rhodospirillaceae bacterium]|nr:hypothetical protein [Rhodospirillaceae bacterium]
MLAWLFAPERRRRRAHRHRLKRLRAEIDEALETLRPLRDVIDALYLTERKPLSFPFDLHLRLRIVRILRALPSRNFVAAVSEDRAMRAFVGLAANAAPEDAAFLEQEQRRLFDTVLPNVVLYSGLLDSPAIRRTVARGVRRGYWIAPSVPERDRYREASDRLFTRHPGWRPGPPPRRRPRRAETPKPAIVAAPRRSRWWLRRGTVLWGLVGLVALIALWISATLPAIDEIKELIGRPSVEVTVADDGEVLLSEHVYPVPVSPRTLPPYVVRAIVETEDRRFYSHPGFDPVGIGRAVVDQVRTLLGDPQPVSGGSTITQQVAKNMFLSRDRTMLRKVRELILAIKLEILLSKEQIAGLYINRIFWGGNIYGIEHAARHYFGVRAPDLNLYQAAMLAGIIRAPNYYRPDRSIAAAHRRTRLVLGILANRGVIAPAVMKQALAQWAGKPLAALRTGDRGIPAVEYRYFEDWIRSTAREMAIPPGETHRIFLTLDPLVQIYAQLAAERLMREGRRRDVTEAAVVAMSPDGAVRAMVGGSDYAGSQFNRAVQAHRPPASAFKPFVYLAALRQGMTPETVIEDAPVEIDGRPWPANFDRRYHGRVTLTEALAQSMNAATVRLLDRVGLETVVSVARHLGIASALPRERSLALGAGGVTPLELTGAYAVFANEGLAPDIHGIVAVQAQTGRIVYLRDDQEMPARLVERDDVAALNGMLREAMRRGTGRAAAFARQAAGKTGTSQDSRDAWFVGYTADLVAGIWVGNDDNAPMAGVTGGSLPAKYWNNLMANVYQERTMPPLLGVER